MKRILTLIAGIVLPVVMCLGVLMVPSFADNCNGVQTAIIGNGGCYTGGIWGLLGMAIDILTIGIGGAAVIGIIISGIQYMAASGDPATITKAKKRIFEIAIGLLVYGIFYGLMRWLLPGWG